MFHPHLRKGKGASRHINKTVETASGRLCLLAACRIMNRLSGTIGRSPRHVMLSARLDRQWIIRDARTESISRSEACGSSSSRQTDFRDGARRAFADCRACGIRLCGSSQTYITTKALSAAVSIRSGPMRRRRNRTCARTCCRRSPRLKARRSAPRTSSPISPRSWRIRPSSLAFAPISSARACACR